MCKREICRRGPLCFSSCSLVFICTLQMPTYRRPMAATAGVQRWRERLPPRTLLKTTTAPTNRYGIHHTPRVYRSVHNVGVPLFWVLCVLKSGYDSRDIVRYGTILSRTAAALRGPLRSACTAESREMRATRSK